MINKEFVRRKIALIQNELAHLKKFSIYTMEEIVENFERQALVERMLERIINRAIDINQHIVAENISVHTNPPVEYMETFLLLADIGVYSKEFSERIGKSVGTRNILTHEYDKADQKEIYLSIADCLREYDQYCKYILDFLEGE